MKKHSYDWFLNEIDDATFTTLVLTKDEKWISANYFISLRNIVRRKHELGIDKNHNIKHEYINDGLNNFRHIVGEPIPEGYVLGKLPLSRNWEASQHKHHSEETKHKISEAKKGTNTGENNSFYGKHHTDETRASLSTLRKGQEPSNKGHKMTTEEKLLRDQNIIKKYGSLTAFNEIVTKNIQQTKQQKYGDPNYNNRQKCAETTYLHYGIDFYCMSNDFRKGHGNESKYNDYFKNLLKVYNLFISDAESCEYPIHRKQYDFKVENTLIEIDPYFTHNSTFGIYNDPPKNMYYHQDKTILALDNSMSCIHIFDWDNPEMIIQRFIINNIIYARKCEIKELRAKDIKEFINKNHLQGSCNGQKICLGLFYNNELIQVMTFGNPRYNKNFEYELLRLCTKLNTRVIGGAEKLFKYFLVKYNPKSIISYCDNAKFKGGIYNKLGFKLKEYGKPGKHWYNPKTEKHITDNLLRQQGFDRLLGKDYGCFGKGTSNEELMLQHNFVEIYDCGQSVYEYIV